jgi:hypothetical protein
MYNKNNKIGKTQGKAYNKTSNLKTTKQAKNYNKIKI